MINSSSPRKARVTTGFKARRVETGDGHWFPEGTILWHVEVGDEFARFMEIGDQGVYELPIFDFESSVRNLSR